MNIQEYSIATITVFDSKNQTTIAKEVGVHPSTASRFLASDFIEKIDFKPFINRAFRRKKNLTIVVDEVVVNKRYSENIEGTSYMLDPASKTFATSYRIVTIGITDGNFFIPIDCQQWIAEWILKDSYKKITDIAKLLISKLLDLNLNIKNCVMDGLYFTKEFTDWLCEQKLNFTIKAKTTSSVLYKGEKIQLQHCKDLILNNNQSAKTIVAEWNGKIWHFTAMRRMGKRGPKVIYLISNFKTRSKNYAKIYNARWTIEKCFRTTKQSLGLKDSSSRYANIYLAHIKCVFFGYALLQLIRKKFKLKSTEEAIRKVQAWNDKYGFDETVQKANLLENYA